MRKFIYLFMFLFACTSYAQTEQISGQFRLIGTQEQPEADKVLTIDDNGDVGYNTLEGVNRNSFVYSNENECLDVPKNNGRIIYTPQDGTVTLDEICLNVTASDIGKEFLVFNLGDKDLSINGISGAVIYRDFAFSSSSQNLLFTLFSNESMRVLVYNDNGTPRLVLLELNKPTH